MFLRHCVWSVVGQITYIIGHKYIIQKRQSFQNVNRPKLYVVTILVRFTYAKYI